MPPSARSVKSSGCRPHQSRSRARTAALATAGALSIAGGVAAAGYLAYRLIEGRRGKKDHGTGVLRRHQLDSLLARVERPSLRLAEEAVSELVARTSMEASLPETDEEKSALVSRMLTLYCQRASAAPLVVCGTVVVGTAYYASAEVVLDRYGLKLDPGARERLGEDVRRVLLAAGFGDTALASTAEPVEKRVREGLVAMQPPADLADFLGDLARIDLLAGGFSRASAASASIIRENYSSATSVLRYTHELAGQALSGIGSALGSGDSQAGVSSEPGAALEPLFQAAVSAVAEHLSLLKAQFAADVDTLIPTSAGVAFAYYARPLQNMSYEAYYASLGPAAEPLVQLLSALLAAKVREAEKSPPEHGSDPSSVGPSPASLSPAAQAPAVQNGPANAGPEPAGLSASALKPGAPVTAESSTAADGDASGKQPAQGGQTTAPEAQPAAETTPLSTRESAPGPGAPVTPVKFSQAELVEL